MRWRPPRRLQLPLLFVAFTVAVWVQYFGVWYCGFYKDDLQWIADARDVNRDFAALWHPDRDNPELLVRPLQRLMFAGLFAAAGVEPAAYHIAGLLWHALAGVFVFLFVRAVLEPGPHTQWRRTTWIAVASAGVFLLARNAAVAVVWISAHSTIVSTIAMLALAVVVLRPPQRLSEGRTFAVVVAGFVVALYAKSTAVSFAIVYPLLARRGVPDRPWSRIALQTAILALVAVVHAVFTKAGVGGVDVVAALSPGGTEVYRLSGNVPQNIAGSLLGSFIVPREYHQVLGAGAAPYLGAAAVLAAAMLALIWVRDHSAVLIALVWIVAMALPTSLFDYNQYDARQLMAGRYLYAGMAGLALLVGVWLAAAIGARPLRRVLPLLVLVAAAWIVWQQRTIVATMHRNLLYTAGWNDLVTRVLQWAKATGAAPGTELYAVHWEESDEYVRAMNRVYFETSGLRLHTERALRDLPLDAVPLGVHRYALKFDPFTRRFSLHAVDDAATRDMLLVPPTAPPPSPAPADSTQALQRVP